MAYAGAVAEGSPYRTSGKRSMAPKVVAFHHRRFALVVAIATIVSVGALFFIRLPRNVTVTCAGLDGPALECASESVSFLGRQRHFRTTVHAPFAPGLPAAFQPRATLDDLRLFTESRSRNLGLEMALFASLGSGQGSRLTPWLPDADEPSFSDLDVYRRALARGAKVPIRYGTAWAGWELSAVVWFLAGMAVWLTSGSSRIEIDADGRRIVCKTRDLWPVRFDRRELSREQIADAIVFESGKGKARVFRPALVLTDGEEVVLGTTGPGTPERATHFVTVLRRALELEHDPGANA